MGTESNICLKCREEMELLMESCDIGDFFYYLCSCGNQLDIGYA